jgi:hypothetical protein
MSFLSVGSSRDGSPCGSPSANSSCTTAGGGEDDDGGASPRSFASDESGISWSGRALLDLEFAAAAAAAGGADTNARPSFSSLPRWPSLGSGSATSRISFAQASSASGASSVCDATDAADVSALSAAAAPAAAAVDFSQPLPTDRSTDSGISWSGRCCDADAAYAFALGGTLRVCSSCGAGAAAPAADDLEGDDDDGASVASDESGISWSASAEDEGAPAPVPRA